MQDGLLDFDTDIYYMHNPYGNVPHFTNRDRTVPVRTEPKIRRNDKCPCGSGLKYKKCCAFGNELETA